MPVLPGADAFSHDGGRTGALLCHGFTGSPQTLRPWADYLAAAGLTVSLPRLPGHGTTWQEMARTRWEDWYAELDRALGEMRARTDQVFVMGISIGGCLALRLAEVHGDSVSGLVLVNPSVTADSRLFALAPLLKLIVPSLKGIASDIATPGVTEVGYERVPVKAAASLPALWRVTAADLGTIRQPVLVYRSTTDHVVGPASVQVLRRVLPDGVLEVRDCPRSFHVATLDYDAADIFSGSLDFVRSHSRAGME